jgi:hypothetical protein
MTTKEPEGDRPKRTSRLDAELAEILERTDRPPSNVIKFRAKARQSRGRWRALQESVIGPNSIVRRGGAGGLLLGSLVFALVGSRVNSSSHLAAYVLGILALACFVGVFVIGFRESKGGQFKTWRGQDIRIEPSRPSWMNRKPKPPKR